LAQEAWAKVLARPGRAVHEPVGWLRRVVTNVWRNRARGERRHRAHAEAAPPGAVVPSPEEIAIREEVRRNVVAAVLALPAPLRDVVVLHFHEGLASPEIGARLQLSPSGVRTRMQQAMELLRQRLDDEHGGRRAAWTVPLLQWRRHAPALPANAPIAIATWLRAAVVLLAAATASLWLAYGDADPQAPGSATSSPAPVAAAVASDSRADPPKAEPNERVAIAATTPPPRAYRGDLPTGSLRGVVRDGVDGRPVPELVVRLHAIEPASSAIAPIELGVSVQRETRTDANAEFTFAALPAGSYEIETASGDGRSSWRRLAVGGDERRVELWLYERPFAGNATVKVLDATKRPVAGAAVTLVLHCTRHGAIGWNGAPAIRGTTDALGTFQLRDPQRLQTVFEGLATATTDDGRAGTTVIGRPEHRGDRSYWEVTVANQGEIAASITGAGDETLAAVQAFAEPLCCYDHVWPDGPRYPLLRAADGSFTASVPAGRYHVRVTAPGKRRLLDKPSENWQFLPAVKVKPGARAETAIALGDAAVVRGRVRDEHGAPIAGAGVRALRATPGFAVFLHTERGPQPEDVYAGSKALTDAAGDYELPLAPGTWHVVAIAAGHAMDVHSDVAVAAEPIALEHSLRADGALQGATDLSWFALRAVDAPSVVHGIPVSDGVFALRGLAPGTWQAGRYDQKFTTLTTFEVTAGGLVWLDLDRATSGTACGIVQHAGSPVPGLDVVGTNDNGWRTTAGARTTTGDDGSFALAVPAGATELRLEHRGVLLQRVRWHDERRELGVIELGAQRISVQAVGPDGRPEAATIWAANWNDLGQPPRRFAPDGCLDGQWMPTADGGDPAVGVRFSDGSEQTVKVTARNREIVVQRRPGGSLELRVLDPEGCPRPAAAFQILPWARGGEAPRDGASFVAARDRSASGKTVVTDGRGRAIVHGIMPGPALVYFAGDWGDFGPGANGRRGPSPLEQVVEVRGGSTQVVDLVLPRY